MVSQVADRKGHDRRYSLDDSALRAMGYAPRIPLSEGLKSTVRWYEENRAWWEPLKRPPKPPLKQAATEPAADAPLVPDAGTERT